MHDTKMGHDGIIHVLPEQGHVIKGIERDTVWSDRISEGHPGSRHHYDQGSQLQQVQLRLLRYYLVDMWGEEWICLDYFGAYASLDGGLHFGLCPRGDARYCLSICI